jgi:hypothetical protein
MFGFYSKLHPNSEKAMWWDSTPITTSGLYRAFDWLLSSATVAQLLDPTIVSFVSWPLKPNTKMYLGYAGHGAEIKGRIDTFDQVFVASDGFLVDDDVHNLIRDRMNDSSSLISIVDCCSSGTIADLPFIMVDPNTVIPDDNHQQRDYIPGIVIFLSACSDSQAAKEAGCHGVFTTKILSLLQAQQVWDLSDLMLQVTLALAPYGQNPVWSFSHPDIREVNFL